MSEFVKRVQVRPSPEVTTWLDEKAGIGYKKATVMRLVLTEFMYADKDRRGSSVEEVAPW